MYSGKSPFNILEVNPDWILLFSYEYSIVKIDKIIARYPAKRD
jgi:hypothetical protein